MATQTASTKLSTLELSVLDALDSLTGCPECEMGTFTLDLYRENGRVKVECGMCGGNRNFTDAHRPTA